MWKAGELVAPVCKTADEAFAQARAANPRPADATLRHRVRHNLRAQSDGTLTFKYDSALRRNPRALFDRTPDQLWAAWRAMTCPVLLVRGEDSDVLAAGTADRMRAENARVSFASVPDCGHSITLDRPDGLLAAVSPWLAATAAEQPA